MGLYLWHIFPRASFCMNLFSARFYLEHSSGGLRHLRQLETRLWSWCKALTSYYSSYKKWKLLIMLVWERLNFHQLSVALGLETASTSQVKGKHQAEARETSHGSEKHSQRLGWKSRNWKTRGMSDFGCRTWLSGRYREKLAACAIQMKERFSFVKFSLFPSNWILSHSPSMRFIPILSGMPVAQSQGSCFTAKLLVQLRCGCNTACPDTC